MGVRDDGELSGSRNRTRRPRGRPHDDPHCSPRRHNCAGCVVDWRQGQRPVGRPMTVHSATHALNGPRFLDRARASDASSSPHHVRPSSDARCAASLATPHAVTHARSCSDTVADPGLITRPGSAPRAPDHARGCQSADHMDRPGMRRSGSDTVFCKLLAVLLASPSMSSNQYLLPTGSCERRFRGSSQNAFGPHCMVS